MATLFKASTPVVIPSFRFIFLTTHYYLEFFFFNYFSPSPRTPASQIVEQSLGQSGRSMFVEAFWPKMSLSRRPCTWTKRISGADTRVFLPDPFFPPLDSHTLQIAPHGLPAPAPRPSSRSRGSGTLLSPSGRNSNSRNSWPNLPLWPT